VNKVLIISVVLIVGLAYWAYKGTQTFQAYQLAVNELSGRSEITDSLGTYEINYDWWFGIFRALRYGKIQEFEFHLVGQRDNAVGVVNLEKNSSWKVICVNVVNGGYLNNRIIHDC
jgi:hypothetical protein